MQVNGNTRIRFYEKNILILVHSILRVREYEHCGPQLGSGFSYRGRVITHSMCLPAGCNHKYEHSVGTKVCSNRT
jgi:hypothetical protein